MKEWMMFLLTCDKKLTKSQLNPTHASKNTPSESDYYVDHIFNYFYWFTDDLLKMKNRRASTSEHTLFA